MRHDCRLMLKGRKCEMSLKGGDAQQGELITKYDGGRPTHADYNPMRKQGGLVLGTGGDNSDRAMGIFCKLQQLQLLRSAHLMLARLIVLATSLI